MLNIFHPPTFQLDPPRPQMFNTSPVALMNCIHCNACCIKKGTRNNIQQYYCKLCRKYQRKQYKKRPLSAENIQMIGTLNNESVGVKGIARILKISPGAVINYIRKISRNISIPIPYERGQTYEVDEMRTFVKQNNSRHTVWIMYAINKATRRVIHFIVGRRTKTNLQRLIRVLQKLSPQRIYTDGLNIYPAIIRKDIHQTWQNGTNYIERKNLTLRTHLKRLGRKTICFSKSQEMLEACLKIYFAYKG